jgi:hypothetical protein
VTTAYLCSHIVAVLDTKGIIDITTLIMKLAKVPKGGRPPARDKALSLMGENVNMDFLSPERWRFQHIIRESG